MSFTFKQDNVLVLQLERQEKYLASRDYQVVKAYRQNVTVDSLYHGHTEWYNGELEKLHALENEIQEKYPEDWEKVLFRRNAEKPPVEEENE